jgi:hypothetical protein
MAPNRITPANRKYKLAFAMCAFKKPFRGQLLGSDFPDTFSTLDSIDEDLNYNLYVKVRRYITSLKPS